MEDFKLIGTSRRVFEVITSCPNIQLTDKHDLSPDQSKQITRSALLCPFFPHSRCHDSQTSWIMRADGMGKSLAPKLGGPNGKSPWSVLGTCSGLATDLVGSRRGLGRPKMFLTLKMVRAGQLVRYHCSGGSRS
jgi:hypothetical protein